MQYPVLLHQQVHQGGEQDKRYDKRDKRGKTESARRAYITSSRPKMQEKGK